MSDLEFLMYQDFILGAISAEEYAEFLKNKKPETLLSQAFRGLLFGGPAGEMHKNLFYLWWFCQYTLVVFLGILILSSKRVGGEKNEINHQKNHP